MESTTGESDRPIGVSGVFVIRVTGVSRSGSEIQGDVLNTGVRELGQFQSYFQLYRKIQEVLDQLGSPQRFCARRSLLPAPPPEEGELPPEEGELPPEEGRLPPDPAPEPLTCHCDPTSPELQMWVRGGCCALFFLRVFYRQNATWQGHLYWADQRVGGYFRSVMELFELMDEVIGTLPKEQADPPAPDRARDEADGEVAYEP